MLNDLEIFFGKFAAYISATLLAGLLVCGIGWYVTGYQLDAAHDKNDYLTTQLKVSNGSFDSIKGQYSSLVDRLQENQRKVLENQEIMKTRLAESLQHDQGMIDIENQLRNRPSTEACLTPKDLRDVWSKL